MVNPTHTDRIEPVSKNVITIKKYPNRRLYDTDASRYVVLDDLAGMVQDGQEFTVLDAKTGEDLTRSVLTQIIVEQEGRGQSLLSIGFLRQIIGLYGDNLGRVVPQYLEHTMQSFSRNEERLRNAMRSAWDDLMSSLPFEDINKRNQQFFENAMGLFRTFQGPERAAISPASPRDQDLPENDREIEILRSKIAVLQKELDQRLAIRNGAPSTPARLKTAPKTEFEA